MAVRDKTITRVPSDTEAKTWVVSWEGLLNGDTGSPLEMSDRTDRSVQILGTFGAGGTIVIEGSNDGTNYVTLTDAQGNAISKTAASIEMVLEVTRYIRPSVTAGDGTTDLDVHMLVTGSRRS